jgi:hypothetical protein
VYHRAVVRLYFLCARRPELTHAQYAAHLVERHAPLALRHHGTLRGYVLNVVDDALDGAEPIDSVNALEYDALEDFQTRNYDSAEGERVVTEDHARFLGGAAGYATAPRAFAAAREPARVKWLCALRSRADLAVELVPEVLAAHPKLAQLSLARVEKKLYPTGRDWDAFLELGFADPVAAPAHPFDSYDCALSLRRRIAALCPERAVWRVTEHVLRT